MFDLPAEIGAACKPLFDVLPLEQSMPHLVGSFPNHTALVEEIVSHSALAGRKDLVAALWLYVSDLERSHTVSQNLMDTTGSYWHGIMHRREGDFGNSHYWMHRAAGHPLLKSHPELDPDSLIDRVAATRGEDQPELVQLQREEWQTLFEWCAARP